ncbi:MAG TPA: DUF4347 domain-containing protein, partial [Crinalium sp.]
MSTNSDHPILGSDNQLLQINPLETSPLLPGLLTPQKSASSIDSSTIWIPSVPANLEQALDFTGAIISFGPNLNDSLNYQDSSPLSIHTGEWLVGQHQSTDILTNPGNLTRKPFQEVVFVDPGVKDYQQIVEDIVDGINPSAEVIILDGTRDGISQISEVLSQKQDIRAVHLISHGNEAALRLGTTTLTGNNLSQYAEQLQGWKAALTDTADIFLYGCDVASGQDGQSFVNRLGQLTGADVEASDDLTGASNLGGDWDLEYASGTIDSTALNINYSHVLLTPITLQELYAAWQSNSLPDLDSIQLTLDGNSIFNGTLNADLSDPTVLRLTGSNLTSFVGAGATTATTDDDTGLTVANVGFDLLLNADSTYSYAFTGQASLTGITGLTLASDSITASGSQAGTVVNLSNFQFGMGSAASLSGSALTYSTQNNQITFSATDASALIGYGADTQTTNDDMGLAIAHANFELTSTSGQPYTYTLSQGSVSFNGLSDLTFSADSITATGDANSTTVTVNDYSLDMGAIAQVHGSALNFNVQQSNGDTTVSLSSANTSAFVGYGLTTPDSTDDVGIGISDVGFALTLNSDKTYDYHLDKSATTQLTVQGLPAGAMQFAQNAGALLSSIVGTKAGVTLTLNNIDLSLSDYAKLSGNLELKVIKDETGVHFSLIGSDIDAFVGYGLSTPDTSDNVGIGISDVGFSFSLNSDKTYDYHLDKSATTQLTVQGLPAGAMQFAQNAGALLSSIVGTKAGVTLTLNNIDLTLSDYAKLTGNLELKVIKDETGVHFSLIGSDIDAFVGYGLSTPDTSDDVGIGISDVSFTFTLNSDKTYDYHLDKSVTTQLTVQGLPAGAMQFAQNAGALLSSIVGTKAGVTLTLNNIDLSLSDYAKLSGNLELKLIKDETGVHFSLVGSDIDAFVGYGLSTTDTSDDVGIGISDVGFTFTLNSDKTYDYHLDKSVTTQLTVQGLPAGAMQFAQNAGALLSSIVGTKAGVTLTLNNIDLSLSDYAKLSGNLELKVIKDETGVHFSLIGSDIDAFVGYGLSTPDTSDDVGIGISDVGFSFTLNSDKTYDYHLDKSATTQLTVQGLPAGAMQFAQNAGALLSSIVGTKAGVTLTLNNIDLTLSDY